MFFFCSRVCFTCKYILIERFEAPHCSRFSFKKPLKNLFYSDVSFCCFGAYEIQRNITKTQKTAYGKSSNKLRPTQKELIEDGISAMNELKTLKNDEDIKPIFRSNPIPVK